MTLGAAPNVTVLVTGASGFIGSRLCASCAARGWRLDAVSRGADVPGARRRFTSLAQARAELRGVDVVYHAAGLAHAAWDRSELMRVNVEETAQLYAAACDAKVAAFVYLSSIKVLGDASRRPWYVDDPLDPRDAYAESKARAETELGALAERGPTRLHIVRPPLVYGPGVGANFLALLKLAASRVPLPLGGAVAPRAWLALDNLTDLLMRLADQEARAPGVWHVRDEEETSVAEMMRVLRGLLGRPDRLVTVRPALARTIGRLLGRGAQVDRLFLPLQVDMERTREALNWTPPVAQLDALKATVTWYRTSS